MVYGLAVVALGYAPTMRPVGQQRSAVQMQEAAGQPDAISTTGGYVEAPTALKDELGAIGPLGYWDPLGMVCSPTRQSPCVLPRCVMNAAALHALSRWSLALPATPYRPLPLPLLSGSTAAAPDVWQGKARPDKFQRWRAVEIKHGRIAMMATTGAGQRP
jgi:hypothetical protein